MCSTYNQYIPFIHAQMASNQLKQDIDAVVKEVSELISGAVQTRLSGIYTAYTEYKETHDALLNIPAVQRAIRDGVQARADAETQQVQDSEPAPDAIANALAMIERLQNDVRALQLENDALRLQISEPENENITLIIEDAEIVEPTKERQNVTDAKLEEEEEEEEASEEEEAEEEAEEEDEEEEEEEEEEEAEEDDSDEKEAEAEAEDGSSEEKEEKEEEVVEEEEEEVVEEEEEEVVEEEEEEAGEEEEEEVVEEEEEEAGEEEEEEEEVVEEEEEEAGEEVEVFEVEIKGKTYFTTDETSGAIYESLPDGDIGDEVGSFVKGKPIFKAKSKA
jgi:hypothetical protein